MKLIFLLFLAASFATFTVYGKSEFDDLIKNYNVLTTQILEYIFQSKSSNFYITPFSASITFGALRDGAKGKTASEITAKFGFPPNVDPLIHAIVAPIGDYMRGFKTFYVSKDYQINDRIKEIAEKYYVTGIENIDLSDTKAAAARINCGIVAQTREIIQNTIKPSDIDPSAKLFTVSAEAYQGRFQLKRNATLSQTEFRVDSQNKHTTVSANFKGTFRYYEDTELKIKVLEIPLEGQEIYFRVVLPENVDGIKDLEERTAELLAISESDFKQEQVVASIPKFAISSVWHQDCLTESMPSIFSDGKADLSGIAGDPGDLFLNSVTQKAYIRFNEYGLEIPEDPTEDSKVQTGADSVNNPYIKEFKADHPFFFYIRQADLFHFVGRLNDPTEDPAQEQE